MKFISLILCATTTLVLSAPLPDTKTMMNTKQTMPSAAMMPIQHKSKDIMTKYETSKSLGHGDGARMMAFKELDAHRKEIENDWKQTTEHLKTLENHLAMVKKSQEMLKQEPNLGKPKWEKEFSDWRIMFQQAKTQQEKDQLKNALYGKLKEARDWRQKTPLAENNVKAWENAYRLMNWPVPQ